MAEINYKPELLKSEDDVENKFIQELFTKILKYELHEDLKWKVPVTYQEGREVKTKIADLVVYKNNEPVIAVEAKKPTESINKNIGQVDSYSAKLEVRYSVITNGRSFILREYLAGNKKINLVEETIYKLHNKNYNSLINILAKENINLNETNKLQEEPKVTNEITDYRRFFRSIHNIIRDNEKLDPAGCFDEFSKILYLKMADEQYKNEGMDKYRFNITTYKSSANSMKLINDWFETAMKTFYSDVFEEIPQLEVSVETLEKVLKKLENFYMKDGKMDIKGRAFEEFLPSQLRGKGLGQYFTPRNIVDFMVEIADVSMNDIIVDFACGSGGFLIKSFDKMKQILNSLPEKTFNSIGTTKLEFEETLKKEQIFGIDAEPRAVRVAKMNMMLWGDGKRIVRGNGLAQDDWKGDLYSLKEFDPEIEGSGCTLILANPPFIKEKDSKVLSQYEISEGRKSIDAQSLFVERGIRLLRPGGRMLIVLPEGVLSNEASLKTREYILKNAFIKGIFELPTHTFVQSGVDTVNTVILYIEKYELELKEKVNNVISSANGPAENINIIKQLEEMNYEIFMSSVENVGFEPNGRVFVKKGEKTDLDMILNIYKNMEINNEKKDLMVSSLKKLKNPKKQYRGKVSNYDAMLINLRETKLRLDPSYYLFWKNIGDNFNNYVPLKYYKIKFHTERVNLSTEEEIDKEYAVYGVDKNNPFNQLVFNEIQLGEDLIVENSKKKIAPKNSIVYNPYRASIGSFAYVPEEFDNALVSGAYTIFTTENFDERLLVYLFKSPIYNQYIKILSTGSVRDNFGKEELKNILIPKLSSNEQQRILKQLEEKNRSIRSKYDELNDANYSKVNYIYDELRNSQQ